MLLELVDVDVRYGDFLALSGISLALTEGETLAVLGANGAGKSTLLEAIAGLLPVAAGRVRFAGADLAGVPTHQRVARGISLVPEGRRLFASLTVAENLQVGAVRARPGPWRLEAVYELFPLLGQRRDRRAAALSGGEQQTVAIARALMANPRLLLLDEVSLGLAPIVVRQLYAALPQITAAGTTVLLVEQNMHQAMAVADRVHCLLAGRTVLTGPTAQVSLAQVGQAYFGVTEEATG